MTINIEDIERNPLILIGVPCEYNDGEPMKPAIPYEIYEGETR